MELLLYATLDSCQLLNVAVLVEAQQTFAVTATAGNSSTDAEMGEYYILSLCSHPTDLPPSPPP